MIENSLLAISSGDSIDTPQVDDVSQPAGRPIWLEKDKDITIVSHPLGIKPSGNAYSAEINIKASTGDLRFLPDEVICQVLEYLDASSLQNVGTTCKFFYAFSRLEDLWKSLCIEHLPSPKTWHGTWRGTYLKISKERLSKISCTGLYSDILHRPFLCANISLFSFCSKIPPRNEIARLSNLSTHEFSNKWTDTPFILSEPVKQWPIHERWSTETMLEKYGNIKFRAEAVDWHLRTYVEYMNDNQDESPLYLFDRSFVEKTNILVGKAQNREYWSPACFGDDLFSVLGQQRPDFRWLIVGPARSGSTFHKDPNATSACNAVLRGSKYWIMFPTRLNGPPPPGVFVSEDQSEVTSPLSIAEWLLGFHEEARKTPGCKEGICRGGEVLHVPSGWWHLVVNLEPSIAITQNFVPEKHLMNVLDFLKNQPQSISGFGDDVTNVFELFVQKLGDNHPDLLNTAMKSLNRNGSTSKRKWEQLVESQGPDDAVNDGGFSFGFGDAEDDEDVP